MILEELVKLATAVLNAILAKKYDEAAEMARRLSVKLAAKKAFRRAGSLRGK